MPAFDFSGYSTKNYSSPSNKGSNNKEKYRTSTTYQTSVTPQQIKTNKKKVELATGKSQLDNYQVKKVPAIIPGSTILNAAQKLRQKSFEANRKFYQEKVLKSKNTSGYVDTLESYESYMKNRLSGKTDAYGNVNPGYGVDKDNNIQTQKVTAGGQTILTKEKTPAETKVAEEKKEYDARQTKKKGRRKNTLTSSQGVMKTSADYSLGKKSLLGQVV
jgi:hypothetical protein